MLALVEAHAADVDALDRHTVLDEVQDTRRIREEQQAAVVLVLRIVVDAHGLCEVDDMALDAGRRDLFQQRRADLVMATSSSQTMMRWQFVAFDQTVAT